MAVQTASVQPVSSQRRDIKERARGIVQDVIDLVQEFRTKATEVSLTPDQLNGIVTTAVQHVLQRDMELSNRPGIRGYQRETEPISSGAEPPAPTRAGLLTPPGRRLMQSRGGSEPGNAASRQGRPASNAARHRREERDVSPERASPGMMATLKELLQNETVVQELGISQRDAEREHRDMGTRGATEVAERINELRNIRAKAFRPDGEPTTSTGSSRRGTATADMMDETPSDGDFELDAGPRGVQSRTDTAPPSTVKRRPETKFMQWKRSVQDLFTRQALQPFLNDAGSPERQAATFYGEVVEQMLGFDRFCKDRPHAEKIVQVTNEVFKDTGIEVQVEYTDVTPGPRLRLAVTDEKMAQALRARSAASGRGCKIRVNDDEYTPLQGPEVQVSGVPGPVQTPGPATR